MGAGQEQEAERDSKQRREDEPASREQVDFFPVLENNDRGDRNGNENAEWGGDVHGNDEGEQWDGNEGLAEAEGGADQGSEEDDGEDQDGSEVDEDLPKTRAVVVYTLAPLMNHQKFCSVFWLGLALGLGLLNAGAVAQDRVAAAVASLPAIKKIDQVAISPDGTKVAYIVEGELSVAAAAGGGTQRIEQKLPARDGTWAADSGEIAWLGDLPGEVPA